MAARFIDRLFPLNTRRRLFVRAIKRLAANPSLIFRLFSRASWNKFIYFNGVLEPAEIEKRLDRKFAEYSRAEGSGPGAAAGREGAEYLDYIFNVNSGKGADYRDISALVLPDTGIRQIAFYLPQYHPIPENDAWWGRGFTEWSNVARGVPQFAGHYQPRVPGELGFYDLRVPEIRRRQVELAKQYGIYGFCFHYYWFGGKTLLDMPLEKFTADSSIDFPFCINWANENWNRTWDGLENDVLIRQKHSPQDDIDFITRISKYLAHRNYIKIGSRPLLSVYRPALLPDAKATAKRWRDWCRANGIGEIYIAATHAFEHINPGSIGFDAAIEFAPNTFPLKDITSEVKPVNPGYSGQVFDYRNAVRCAMDYKKPAYKKFRGICPGWDNDARKPGRGITLVNSSPAAYGEWMETLCAFTDANFENDEKLIFINSWNEWAEGAYLEPDKKSGYAYLEAGAKAPGKAKGMMIRKEGGEYKQTAKNGLTRKNYTVVMVHVYYPSMWDEIRRCLEKFEDGFDLYVSVPESVEFDYERVFGVFKDACVYRHENRGRDMAPFIRILSCVEGLGYRYGLKLHTKKSAHRKDGHKWRRELYYSLAGSPEAEKKAKEMFDTDGKTGMLVPEGHILPSTFYWGKNAAAVKRLAQRAGYSLKDEVFNFAAGSMFWFRPDAFRPLTDMKILNCEFENEEGQVDGTLAHALERFLGLMMTKTGYDILPISGKTGIKTNTAYQFADASPGPHEKSDVPEE